jgi:uncharacterized protein YjlB
MPGTCSHVTFSRGRTVHTMFEPSHILSRCLVDAGLIPNSRLPLLVYPGAVELAGHPDPAAIFEALFARNRWVHSWRDGVYPFHHYHSTAHEVLGVYAGSASVCFGGESGLTIAVQAGDVVVIPAGVAHRRLSSSPGFAVVGAYPASQRWDMNYAVPGERPKADHNIARVPLPERDPVLGESGLPEIWSSP